MIAATHMVVIMEGLVDIVALEAMATVEGAATTVEEVVMAIVEVGIVEEVVMDIVVVVDMGIVDTAEKQRKMNHPLKLMTLMEYPMLSLMSSINTKWNQKKLKKHLTIF